MGRGSPGKSSFGEVPPTRRDTPAGVTVGVGVLGRLMTVRRTAVRAPGAPAPPRGGSLAGRLHQRRGFDEPAKVLLVQMPSGDRLDGALQFREREFIRHQLEYNRAVF